MYSLRKLRAVRRPRLPTVGIYPGTSPSNKFNSCGQDIKFATYKWVPQLVCWTTMTVISILSPFQFRLKILSRNFLL